MTTLNIIAAVADNRALGRDNQLLWHISEDLKFFKRTTMGCPVVMGRRTFESLGRPLPGRLNVVISRSGMVPEASGTVVVASLEEALKIASEAAEQQVFVIGGGQIYSQAMVLADRIYITEVHISPEADTFFPEIDPSLWQETYRSERQTDPKSGLDYEFVTYDRRR